MFFCYTIYRFSLIPFSRRFALPEQSVRLRRAFSQSRGLIFLFDPPLSRSSTSPPHGDLPSPILPIIEPLFLSRSLFARFPSFPGFSRYRRHCVPKARVFPLCPKTPLFSYFRKSRAMLARFADLSPVLTFFYSGWFFLLQDRYFSLPFPVFPSY